MEIEVENEYQLALLDALANKLVNNDNVEFIKKYVDDTDKLEELVIHGTVPQLRALMVSSENFLGLKTPDVSVLETQPAAFNELLCEEILSIGNVKFDVDPNRKNFRLNFAAYLKETRKVLFELVPRIRLQKSFINFQEMQIATLKAKILVEKTKRLKVCKKLKRVREMSPTFKKKKKTAVL